jgi:hypothetical protein
LRVLEHLEYRAHIAVDRTAIRQPVEDGVP